MNNTYPKEFYDFRDGVKVKDNEIRRWLEEIKNDLIDDVAGGFSFRASGNTIVIGFKCVDEYEFIVTDSYMNLNVRKEDIIDLKFL